MIHIDGSQGEGGGQILRSALALSMALGRPFTISNIRANRPKPGLMRQHLTAVEAAAVLCGARVRGAAPASRELVFEPGPVRAGTHRFSVGTAGSTTLVLQAILPALLFAREASDITVEGGTHARWAPPFEFLQHSLVPLLRRMGAEVTVELLRHGFYPAGGGSIRVRVEPGTPRPLTLLSRGEVQGRRAHIILAKLAKSIAQRELARIQERLGWEVGEDAIVWPQQPLSPGNVVSLLVQCEHVTEVSSVIAEQGRSAETVADEAVELAREYLASDAPVGRHLADQLMVPMAIGAAGARCTSAFRSLPFTRHATTNAGIIGAFMPGASRTCADGCVTWAVSGGGGPQPHA